MAERSKALASGASIVRCVGSNPTLINILFAGVLDGCGGVVFNKIYFLAMLRCQDGLEAWARGADLSEHAEPGLETLAPLFLISQLHGPGTG